MLSLSQMRAFAVSLDPALRDERTGLPRIAGAGGTWTMPAVGVQCASIPSGSVAGTVSKLAPQPQTNSHQLLGKIVEAEENPLPAVGPTMLEEWTFYSFRVPFALQASIKPAAEETNIKVIAKVKLAVLVTSGNLKPLSITSTFAQITPDMVFTQEQEVELIGPAKLAANEEGLYTYNGQLAGELVNGLALQHGKTLALALAFSINKIANPSAFGWLANQITATGVASPSQGALTYVAHELTGHRRL